MAMHTSSRAAPLAERRREPSWRRLWQVPTFLIGLLACLGVWFARPLWQPDKACITDEELAHVRRLVETPTADPEELVARLQSLLTHPTSTAEFPGEVQFLLGSALARMAIRAPADKANVVWQEARGHLEQADSLGVSPADQPRLRYRLAQAWLHTGGEKARIVVALNETIGPTTTEDRVEVLGLLAQAHLLPPADVPAALEANKRQLAQPTADDRVLAPARLLRGELLMQLRDFVKARETLRYVGRDAPPAVQARARLLLARCAQETGQWEQAARLWQETLDDRAHPPPDPAAVAYDLGLCYRRLPGRAREAARAFQHALPHGGAYAQAAALRLAELFLQEKTENPLPYLHQGLEKVTQPEDYANSLVPLAEAAALVELACAASRAAGDHVQAQDLAQLLGRVAPAARAAGLLGEVTAEAAAALFTADAEKARTLYAEAGRAFEQAVQAGATAAPLLLRGADCYRQAGATAEAARLLEAFVRLPDLPERKGEAWFRLGEAREALGRPAESVAAYTECVTRGGFFEHQARYRLAILELGRPGGDVNTAISHLTLNASLLSQQPEDRRDREGYVRTLVTLGDLLARQARQEHYHDALGRYAQALAVLGDGPVAWPIRFKIGDCYRHLAQLTLAQRDQARDPSVRQAREDQRRMHLESAASTFAKLEADLRQHVESGGRLTPEQQELQDGLGFRMAGARFDGGQLAEAQARYTALAEQRRGTLDELIALEGILLCQARLGESEKVRATLERLQAALRRVPDSIFTGRTEREDRAYWDSLPRKLDGLAP